MRQKFFRILSIVLLITAAAVLAYPYWSRWYAGEMQAIVMQDYENAALAFTPEAREEMFQEALRYNAYMAEGHLADEHGIEFGDPFGYGGAILPSGYADQLNIPDAGGVIGSIELPTLRIKIPIYKGVEEHILEIGIGHVPQSALPVGGITTHSVLAGHRGLRSTLLFTDLDKLVMGDKFLIHVLDHTLAYEVDQILVVEPDDVSSLAPVEGEDLITLSTCTPLGINSHRLLVRGTRVPYVPFDEVWPDAQTIQLLIALAIILVASIILVIWGWMRRRREKREREMLAVARAAHAAKAASQPLLLNVVSGTPPPESEQEQASVEVAQPIQEGHPPQQPLT